MHTTVLVIVGYVWVMHQLQMGNQKGPPCRCSNCTSVGGPHLTQVVPQLTALAAAAEAAAASETAPTGAPFVSTAHSDTQGQADKDDCPWFNCPISLVSHRTGLCCQQAYGSK